MDKISVNKLVEEVKSNLPREILVLIAQNCLNKNTDIQTTIKNFENEVYQYTLKVQKKVINCTGTLLHTNLGRAQTDVDFNGESTNVEYDIFNNRRGKRNEFLSESMNLLLGSDDVCFVNNSFVVNGDMHRFTRGLHEDECCELVVRATKPTHTASNDTMHRVLLA